MKESDINKTSTDIDRVEGVISRLFLLVPAGFLLLAIVIGFYAFKFFGPLSDSSSTWGEFGDYVGGVLNPIFGFLALIALLWTIALQSKELRFSTQELRHSADALRAQNETLKTQNFEATFFQLLRLHNDIVNAIDIVSGNNVTKGRDCFRIFAKRLIQILKQHDGLRDLKKARIAYDEFYKGHQHELGHYFRLLYNIVKFVKSSDILNKRFYTNLVRAQLSSYELTLIFFNCLSQWGEEKFKPLVEEFALLKTLPPGEFSSQELRDCYQIIAFETPR